MSAISPAFSEALRLQADACQALGSPFSARLLNAMRNLDLPLPQALTAPYANASLAELVAGAVPLRFLAALHDLTLSGVAPILAAHYAQASAQPDWHGLITAAAGSLADEINAVSRFLASPPQTNEVRRCVCLLGGFLAVAEQTRLPLRVFEIGASAGLNLNFDRYSYNIAGAKLGDPASSVVLDTLWTGPPPPRAKLKVIERGGCDIAPLRLEDPAQAQRLEAYVWADQADRLQRLRAAIVITQTEGPRLDCADAAEWLVRRVGTAHGAATVLFHSVMWQYMPPASRTTAAGRIAALGEAATQNAPFAWLRMEPDPQGPAGEMTVWLTFWPGGETKRLAKVHPHGAEVTWFGV